LLEARERVLDAPGVSDAPDAVEPKKTTSSIRSKLRPVGV
jgi:hypothetical protein